MTLIIILVVLLALFGLAFVTKRRFGVLGLALAAGVVLAQNASVFVAGYIKSQSLSVEPLSYSSVATIALILAPALILLAGGPTYNSKRAATVGAVGFALLGTLFLLGPLTTDLPSTDSAVRNVLNIIARYQNIIVICALVLALIDTYMVHGGIAAHHDKKKHKG